MVVLHQVVPANNQLMRGPLFVTVYTAEAAREGGGWPQRKYKQDLAHVT